MRSAVKIAIKGAAALVAATGLAAAQSAERVKTLAPEGAIKPT